ncbi:MAG: hypothetical protein IT428_22935 [Planctomycetaceae bacterium]|nr:hypothetical protein [Planctomycetaceae bacterium]
MQATSTHRLDIPDSLRTKLLAFRRRLWTIKLIEGLAAGAIGVLLGFLLTYAVDRLVETPRLVRWGIFAAAIAACLSVPWALDRWVYRRRRLDQLARLLTRRHASVGDQLLGIIELAGNESEQARSPELVEAAIRQVAEAAEKRDFRDAVPRPQHWQRSFVAGGLTAAAVALLIITTAAAKNAWARFLAPWSNTPRYTFTAIEPLPERMIVPHGETFELTARLAERTERHPATAEVAVAGLPPIEVPLVDGAYKFEVPGQISTGTLRFTAGDFSTEMAIEPMLRPELSKMQSRVTLPEYLGRPGEVEKQIRGGSMTVVKGARTEFTATVSRALASATIDGQSRTVNEKSFASETLPVELTRQVEFAWRDKHGLTGKEPFRLEVVSHDDEAPSLIIENLPRQKVLLVSEVLAFQVRARDDFGVKQVGIEWKGIDPSHPNPAKGERLIGAGGNDKELLELAATFSGTQYGIEPQPVAVRLFVDDYLPGRERVYSPACVFDLLDPEQHAIWITAQLGRWQKLSLEVRDKEMQLHEVNKELRAMSGEELDRPENRRKLETQAAAERANGRRLTNLVASGEDLLKQAMRNPEIGVGHLEKWAEMMQILKDISGNRMPSVADMLKQASTAQQAGANPPTKPSRMAGQNRANMAGGDPKKPSEKPNKPNAVPTITDVESTMNQAKPGEPKKPKESKGGSPKFGLPNTMLAGNGKAKDDNKPETPAGQKVDEAVKAQQDLLAEFDKIADELNQVLANLEGTTLVKRLKASSRKQQQVATKLGTVAAATFGGEETAKSKQGETFKDLSEVESKSSRDVSNIMDDMSAYFERSRFMRFKAVLDDMRKQDVTAGLRTLGDDLRKENGLSIAQAEYWSDTLDRWAEDLVEVTKCGACPGCKSKGSLPPSIVLEVLQILEGEVNLREETRVAEQARPAIKKEEHDQTSHKLAKSQDGLRERIDKVIGRIRELPDGETDFGKEIALLTKVSGVMNEATEILSGGTTGAPAIAAETEAIELLLQSKRFNPNGGGGGGANPGGGGSGSTNDSALALVGGGVNEKEVREDRGTSQTTGTAGPVLPEEFRAGLDEYFNRLEGRAKK